VPTVWLEVLVGEFRSLLEVALVNDGQIFHGLFQKLILARLVQVLATTCRGGHGDVGRGVLFIPACAAVYAVVMHA